VKIFRVNTLQFVVMSFLVLTYTIHVVGGQTDIVYKSETKENPSQIVQFKHLDSEEILHKFSTL
jgi:hypothetical protein